MMLRQCGNRGFSMFDYTVNLLAVQSEEQLLARIDKSLSQIEEGQFQLSEEDE